MFRIEGDAKNKKNRKVQCVKTMPVGNKTK